MLNTKLIPHTWQSFFDDLTEVYRRDPIRRYVLLRVSSPGLMGSRDVAPWLPFEQISYDPETGTLRVGLEGFEYHIDGPVTIWAAVEADGNVERLVAIGRDGTRDYIEFSEYRIPDDGSSGRSRLESPAPFRVPAGGAR
ncbi:MAG TPA: DUF5335 family protein [Rhodothermales bacterium]|nr:DUF5335 family protein [Rhodothermales bacterium]